MLSGPGLHHSILRQLADGRFHSGTALGDELQVSRAAVWKAVGKLQALGIDIHSVRGKGYRLQQPVDLLDATLIRAALPDDTRRQIQQLQILDTVESTNTHVMDLLQDRQLDLTMGQYAVFLAEQQTSGKGRRGRHWVSPWGQNIYLTMARLVDTGLMTTDGISLVVGLAIIRALKAHDVAGVGVKWPNDVLYQGKKLSGILLEMTGDITGICQLVIGVGINTSCQAQLMQEVSQPWTDLFQVTGKLPDRNVLAAGVIRHIMAALAEFQASGMAAFMDEWREYDVMRNRQVELVTAAGSRFGKALGVSESGALLLKTSEGVQVVSGGEISLRSTLKP